MKRMLRNLLTTTAILALTTPVLAGDIAKGKIKAASCAACHGVKGISAVPLYPHLAGQQALYLAKQLKAFKSGERKDPVMGAMSKPLSDEDIANVSAYYASLSAK